MRLTPITLHVQSEKRDPCTPLHTCGVKNATHAHHSARAE